MLNEKNKSCLYFLVSGKSTEIWNLAEAFVVVVVVAVVAVVSLCEVLVVVVQVEPVVEPEDRVIRLEMAIN